MTTLAWPLVSLIVATLVIWRLDVFARRWTDSRAWGKRVAKLEADVSGKAQVDELTALHDKVTQISNRLGPLR